MTNNLITRPFVKWVGGKRQLLDEIVSRMPKSFDHYYEPFIGGGSLLFRVQPQHVHINDTNEQLINVYRQLKDNTDEVIAIVNQLDAVPCDKERYYSLREAYNEKIKSHELDAECASLMIWINKHCFNGVYRVNAKGLYNVPYNNRVVGQSIDEENIRNIGAYLNQADVEITCSDFETACAGAKEGDFVYFDSPYVPISSTADFTGYTKDGFKYEDHVRLAELFRALHEKGAMIIASNNDVPLVHELYDGFNIEVVGARKSINRNADGRKGKEVIITNYSQV